MSYNDTAGGQTFSYQPAAPAKDVLVGAAGWRKVSINILLDT
jgi:hypothetical protein